MRITFRFLLLLRGCILILFLSAAGGSSFAQSAVQPASVWIDSVRALGARIASFTPPADALYFDFENRSSVDAGEAAAIRREMAAELGRRGFHLSTDSGAPAQAEVSLSESADGYLLVARVRRPEGEQVAVVAGPALRSGEGGPGGDSLTLARKAVWEQRRPILDFANLNSANGATDASGGTPLLLLLQPEILAVYAQPTPGTKDVPGAGPNSLSGPWVAAESAPLRHAQPWPRDLRGWIDLNNHKIELPGMECAGNLEKPASMTCAAASAAGKFPRELKQLPLAAPIANGREAGETLLLDVNCGGAPVALATGSGDWTEPDSIQAFEVKDEALVAAGDPLAFAGPVLALWPSGDLKSARVVARNLRTGMYEASIVSVTCGN